MKNEMFNIKYGNNKLYFYKGNYERNGSPAILIVNDDGSPAYDLTVNIQGRGMKKQWIDSNKCPKEIINKLIKLKLIEKLDITTQSGFFTYNLYNIKPMLDILPTENDLLKYLKENKNNDVEMVEIPKTLYIELMKIKNEFDKFNENKAKSRG